MPKMTNIFLIGLVLSLIMFSTYQTTQIEIIKSELVVLTEHYEFAMNTLNFFMGSPEGENLRDDIDKNRNTQFGI